MLSISVVNQGKMTIIILKTCAMGVYKKKIKINDLANDLGSD